jgi:anti-anti-sigma factor
VALSAYVMARAVLEPRHLFDRIREGRHRIILDMLGVSFIDSTGLGLLVGIRKRMHPDEGELRLVITNQSIRRIFKITGLNAVFRIGRSSDDDAMNMNYHRQLIRSPPGGRVEPLSGRVAFQ